MSVNTQDSSMPQSSPSSGGHIGKRKLRSASASPFSQHIASATDKRSRISSENARKIGPRKILYYGDEDEEGQIPNSSSQRDATSAEVDGGRRLHIGDLAYTATEQDLKDFFKNFQVENATFPTNLTTKRPCGYAFVNITPPSEAKHAVRELNGTIMLGRKVTVSLASSGLSEPLPDKHGREKKIEYADPPANANTDQAFSSHPVELTNMLVGKLLMTDPSMPLYTRTLQDIVEICNSPPPGEAALGNIVTLCRVKGADQMKVSEILTYMQPLWSKRLASYLASLICNPIMLKEVLAVMFEEAALQNDLNVPHHMREAIQAMLGGLTASSASGRQAQLSVADTLGSRNNQGPILLQRPPHVVPNRQFLSGAVDAHLRGDKADSIQKPRPHGGASNKNQKNQFAASSKQNTSQIKSSLVTPSTRPNALMSTRTALPLENSFAVAPNLAPAGPTGPKLTTDPSKFAMIIIDAFVPSYCYDDILRQCRESLGTDAGLEKVVCSSDHMWVLHFSSAMAAVHAIGRIVRFRREVVVIRPVPSHILDPTVYDSTPDDDSAPRIFMAVFQDGPPTINEAEALQVIATYFPKLKFSLQGQRRPVANNGGTATRHVKWIIAFDKAPGVAKFRTPISVEMSGGAEQPLSVLWQPVSRVPHCVICRLGHKPVACPMLHHFQCPNHIKIEQHDPKVR